MTESALVAGRAAPNYRLRMAGFMLFADLTGLLLATLGGNMLVSVWAGGAAFEGSIAHGIVLLACMSLFLTSKLYPGVGINPAEEIRRVSQFTLMALMFGVFVSVFAVPLPPYHYQRLVIIWVLSPAFVLGLRWATRITAVHWGLWKEPVLVLAAGQQALDMVLYFRKRLRLGFWPALIASDEEGIKACRAAAREEPVIHLKNLPQAIHQIATLGIKTALVDLSFAGEAFARGGEDALPRLFPRLIFVSDLNWLEGASLEVHDFEGLLGVETRRNELSAFNLALKALMDLAVSFLGLVCLLPLFLLLALLIKLDAPGPVFYRHKRIGLGEKPIVILKFRTMVQDADQILQTYLQTHPEARREWEATQKLKDDPRITRVGRWLRKFSLDELPQLINVLKGDLSLVGARPIVSGEVRHYGEYFQVYTRSKPGLTGLWQVSGRNNTTYDERVRYDTYYIHNWSIWLDIYILLRTVWVILSRDGAY